MCFEVAAASQLRAQGLECPDVVCKLGLIPLFVFCQNVDNATESRVPVERGHATSDHFN